jgi:tetratricopeptide (TPR) repeat protein
MRASVCFALALLACQARRAAPAEQAWPDPFLEAMLDSPDPPPHETAWPAGGTLIASAQPWMKENLQLETMESARAFIDVAPAQMNAHQLQLASFFKDSLSEAGYWHEVVRKDPKNFDAAVTAARIDYGLGDPERALEDLVRVPDVPPVRAAEVHELRCNIYFRMRHFPESIDACKHAGQLDETLGYRTLVKALLVLGKKKEALAQALFLSEQPSRARDPKVQLTVGLAQQMNGQEEQALATWQLARLRWPHDPLIHKALGSRRQPIEWEVEEIRQEHDRAARDLATCGLYYTELGIKDRADACYNRAERLASGPAQAAALVHLGLTNQPEALAQALEAAKANSHINLVSAVAWLFLRGKNLDQAKSWAAKGLAMDPSDVKSASLMQEICAAQKDYPCVVEYRHGLGLATQLSAAEASEASARVKAEAGDHLIAPAPDAGKPPRLSSLSIVPVGDRVAPELEGMAQFLEGRFPGVKVMLAAREELRPGVFKLDTRQVVWERLLSAVRDEPGRIYVVEDDLTALKAPFVVAQVDLARASAAVSLSRLRTLRGTPAEAGTTLPGKLQIVARDRLRAQTAAAAAKLLGTPERS